MYASISYLDSKKCIFSKALYLERDVVQHVVLDEQIFLQEERKQ